MPISSRVRYFAKQAYQLNLMRGMNQCALQEYLCRVYASRGIVSVDDDKGNHWDVPIAKSWANL